MVEKILTVGDVPNDWGLSEADIDCTTEAQIWKSDITQMIFTNLILDAPLEKESTSIAVFNLLKKWVILQKHQSHLSWLARNMEEPNETFYQIKKYLNIFKNTKNELVHAFIFDEHNRVKAEELIKKFIVLWARSALLDYEWISDFDEFDIAMTQSKNWAYWFVQKVDKWVKEILSPQYMSIDNYDNCGMARVKWINGLYWLIQKTYEGVKEILSPQYKEITPFDCYGIARVKWVNGLYWLIQRTDGEIREILSPEYEDILWDFDEDGMICVQGNNELYGLIQKTDDWITVIIKPIHKYPLVESDGKYFVKAFGGVKKQVYPQLEKWLLMGFFSL